MSKILKSYRFDEHTLKLIEELRVSMHMSNNSDVLRRSLTLLKLAVDAQKNGGAIIIKTGEIEREVIL
jgi:Arc/MetJ-type ribon-helix-helix transcriptional regulator